MTVGIIVQSRTGSSRLPAKVMMKADDKSLMIDYVINQLKHSKLHDDIVKATINAATSDSVGEILNVGGGSVFSLSQIIEFMKEITEKEFEIDFNAEQKGDVKHTSADISKAEKLINYKPNTDIKYGLTQQYEYIKTNLNLYDGIINHT